MGLIPCTDSASCLLVCLQATVKKHTANCLCLQVNVFSEEEDINNILLTVLCFHRPFSLSQTAYHPLQADLVLTCQLV